MRMVIAAAATAVQMQMPAAIHAAPINIVALGASNTYGHGRGSHPGGVPPAQAWPAQLQAMLRAKAIDAQVTNAGIPGDTTGDMLARLDSAVPDGTQLVILQPGGNDWRRGTGTKRADNIAAIKDKLRARHIKVVVIGKLGRIAPRATREPDGTHFDANGHAAIARSLLARVLAALR